MARLLAVPGTPIRTFPERSALALTCLVLSFLPRLAEAQAPPAPTLVSPTGTEYIATPTYTWNVSTGATQYRLQVNKPDLSVTYVDTNNPWLEASVACIGSTCSFTPATSLAPNPYSWRVQARNGSGTSAWSASQTFSAAPVN